MSYTVIYGDLYENAVNLTATLGGTSTVTVSALAETPSGLFTASIQGTGTVATDPPVGPSIQITALEVVAVYTHSTSHDLAVELSGSASVTAVYRRTVLLSAALESTGTVTAVLEAKFVELSASMSGSATVTTELSTLKLTDAAIVGTATITTTAPVGPSIQITALEIAGVYTSTELHNLGVGVEGTSTVVASLDTVRDLTAVLEGTADFAAPATRELTFADPAGFLFSSANLTVDLAREPHVAATITGTSTVTTTIETIQLITVVSSGTATVTTVLDVTSVSVSLAISGTATVTSLLHLTRNLTAGLSGTATVGSTVDVTSTAGFLSAVFSGSATVTSVMVNESVQFVPMLMVG